MAQDLTGAVALVTGAASGIGAAVVERLAARGARLVLVDRDEAITDHPAARDGLALVTDVADPEAMGLVVAETERALGRLDLAFLNAGTTGGQRGIVDLDVAAYRALVGVNVDHVVFGTAAAIPAIRRTGGGTIVATSSLAGLIPLGADPLYTMTKYAVVGYVRAAADAAPDVRMLALCPGYADTPLIAAVRDRFTGFPLLQASDVADAFETALADGESGQAWFVQPGRPASPYRFRGVPGPATGEDAPDLGTEGLSR